MAIICQRVVILLRFCADMIVKTLTVHLMPNLSHLEHMEHCYKVINAKAKFLPRGNLEFAFLGFHGLSMFSFGYTVTQLDHMDLLGKSARMCAELDWLLKQ